MTPEAKDRLAKARQSLQRASLMRQAGFLDGAGRDAYIAGHQAAMAWIFEKTGRVAKTHSGARSEFNRLIKDDLRFGPAERRFLGKAYDLKQAADYAIGPEAEVTEAEADEAIAQAKTLVDLIEAALQEEPEEPPQ